MAAHSLPAMENLVMTLRAIASSDCFKEIASVYDSTTSLNKQLEDKHAEVENLRAEMKKMQDNHDIIHQGSLENYRKSCKKLEDEKASLWADSYTLKAAVKDKEDAAAECKDKSDALQNEANELKASLEEEKKKAIAAQNEVAKLKKSVEEKNSEIGKLKESLSSEKNQVSALTKELSESQKDNISLRGQLEKATKKITDLESFASQLHEEDEDKFVEKLSDLWKSAYKLMESTFKEDIPDQILGNQVAWRRLKELELGPQHGQHQVPLPQSNSQAAKQMRIAVMLAILARTIDKDIFQPTYILDGESGIRELLVLQAIADSGKEAYCRSILLSMFPEEQTKVSKERVKEVVGHVGWYAQDLLSVTQFETFKAGLEQIVQSASDLWKTIQRAKQRYEPNFALDDYEDFDWDIISFEERTAAAGEEGSAEVAGAGNDEDLLVIFPRVYAVDDSDPDPITHGVVLKRSQSAEATQELERTRTANPTLGRTATSRARQLRPRSMSFPVNDNRFLPPSTLPSGSGSG